jgi:hypothetical protein
MLGFGARDATKDIDAAITPRNEIMPVVIEIARRRNLTVLIKATVLGTWVTRLRLQFLLKSLLPV